MLSLNFKEQGPLPHSCAQETWGCASARAQTPGCLHGTEKRDPGTFSLSADFLLQPSPPSRLLRRGKGNVLSPYFLTHVSDVQGCDCKQCHQPCQSCLLLPRSVPSTPGVPVIGRKANKAKQ